MPPSNGCFFGHVRFGAKTSCIANRGEEQRAPGVRTRITAGGYAHLSTDRWDPRHIVCPTSRATGGMPPCQKTRRGHCWSSAQHDSCQTSAKGWCERAVKWTTSFSGVSPTNSTQQDPWRKIAHCTIEAIHKMPMSSQFLSCTQNSIRRRP